MIFGQIILGDTREYLGKFIAVLCLYASFTHTPKYRAQWSLKQFWYFSSVDHYFICNNFVYKFSILFITINMTYKIIFKRKYRIQLNTSILYAYLPIWLPQPSSLPTVSPARMVWASEMYICIRRFFGSTWRNVLKLQISFRTRFIINYVWLCQDKLWSTLTSRYLVDSAVVISMQELIELKG